MDIRKELNGVFRDVFRRNDIHVLDHMTAEDVQGWDSIAHVTLVIAVEDHFHVRFSTAEIGAMKNVGEMIRLIERKRERG